MQKVFFNNSETRLLRILQKFLLQISPTNITNIHKRYTFTFRIRRSRGEMYIGHSLCVCLSLVAFPHYSTDADVTWGHRAPSSCAILGGGFTIGAWVSLL